MQVGERRIALQQKAAAELLDEELYNSAEESPEESEDDLLNSEGGTEAEKIARLEKLVNVMAINRKKEKRELRKTQRKLSQLDESLGRDMPSPAQIH